jgi:hypothetical protein
MADVSDLRGAAIDMLLAWAKMTTELFPASVSSDELPWLRYFASVNAAAKHLNAAVLVDAEPALAELTTSDRAMYELPFTDVQWVEINNLIDNSDDEFGPARPRRQWYAIAQMALGKAEMIAAGLYDTPGEDPTETEEGNAQWADTLRDIAKIITDKFKPGDGQL